MTSYFEDLCMLMDGGTAATPSHFFSRGASTAAVQPPKPAAKPAADPAPGLPTARQSSAASSVFPWHPPRGVVGASHSGRINSLNSPLQDSSAGVVCDDDLHDLLSLLRDEDLAVDQAVPEPSGASATSPFTTETIPHWSAGIFHSNSAVAMTSNNVQVLPFAPGKYRNPGTQQRKNEKRSRSSMGRSDDDTDSVGSARSRPRSESSFDGATSSEEEEEEEE